MALLLFAAYWGTGGGILMVIFSLMLTADGVCYVLAHFKGESETQESGYDTLGARTCSRRTQCPQSPATRPRVQLPVHTSHARPRARTRTHTHTSPHLSGLPLPPLHRQLSTLLSLSCAHQNVDKWRQLHQHQHQHQQHQQRSPTSGIRKTSSRIAPTAAACFPMPNRGGRLWGRMSFSLGVCSQILWRKGGQIRIREEEGKEEEGKEEEGLFKSNARRRRKGKGAGHKTRRGTALVVSQMVRPYHPSFVKHPADVVILVQTRVPSSNGCSYLHHSKSPPLSALRWL